MRIKEFENKKIKEIISTLEGGWNWRKHRIPLVWAEMLQGAKFLHDATIITANFKQFTTGEAPVFFYHYELRLVVDKDFGNVQITYYYYGQHDEYVNKNLELRTWRDNIILYARW